MTTQPLVMVGLSGGVDSSVAAWRLQQQGYQVVGVFIKVWHPSFMPCNWEQERLDAMRVAAALDIPFLTCDAEATYHDAVAQEFIRGYEIGKTPNPDILCNKQVKFGAFLSFAKTHGAAYIATGHYVQRFDSIPHPQLMRGIDTEKDQSYFLWSISVDQLAHSLFPVGSSTKPEIRAEAISAKLPTALKRDSQGICFLGQVDIPDFLSHYFTLVPGSVLDTSGRSIGTHRDVRVYTIGQRHGFTVDTRDAQRTPLYVVDRDLAANTITVAAVRPTWEQFTQITLTDTVLRTEIEYQTELYAQFRYRQKPIPVTILEHSHDHTVIKIQTPTDHAASGQSCVLYQGTTCIGGGIIL